VKDTGIQELLQKVKFQHPGDIIGMDLTAEIVVRLINGTEYSQRVTAPKGEPENPLSDEELAAKFESCSGPDTQQESRKKDTGPGQALRRH